MQPNRMLATATSWTRQLVRVERGAKHLAESALPAWSHAPSAIAMRHLFVTYSWANATLREFAIACGWPASRAESLAAAASMCDVIVGGKLAPELANVLGSKMAWVEMSLVPWVSVGVLAVIAVRHPRVLFRWVCAPAWALWLALVWRGFAGMPCSGLGKRVKLPNVGDVNVSANPTSRKR
mgnify:CR=1 FL=1